MGAASLTKERSIAPPQITLSKRAAQLSPHLAKKAADGRLPLAERMIAAESAEAMAVALAQPHRAGCEDPRMAFPLGKLCLKAWPADERMFNAAHAAGLSYAKDVRAVRVARGFHVEGSDAEGPRTSVGSPGDPTPEEIEIARAQIFAAERVLAKANEVLIAVMPGLPAKMERLCTSLSDPSPYDEGQLRNGLWRLGVHYRHIDLGINTGKPT